MIKKLTSKRVIEHDLLLYDPEINEMLRNIIAIIKNRGNQVHRSSCLWRDLALKRITWFEFLSHISLPLPVQT